MIYNSLRKENYVVNEKPKKEIVIWILVKSIFECLRVPPFFDYWTEMRKMGQKY